MVGWGKYLPQRVLTNADLEKLVDTTDEWIVARTGIRQRRIAAPEETSSSMGAAAAQAALQMAKLDPASLNLVIAATSSPEYVFPATASLIQDKLGATKAAAFDLNAACSGFVYGLAVASQFIAAGTYQNALVVGTEVYSRLLDWDDRGTCILFGDGAGAVLLQASPVDPGPSTFVLGSDGSGAELLYVPGPGRPNPTPEMPAYLRMMGPEVFRFAVNIMVDATRQVVAAAGLDLAEIDLFVPHQANERIITAAARSLHLPPEKVYMNLERYGNTSAASIPIALCEAVEEGRLRPGQRALVVGFGGGLSWAAMVLPWG